MKVIATSVPRSSGLSTSLASAAVVITPWLQHHCLIGKGINDPYNDFPSQNVFSGYTGIIELECHEIIIYFLGKSLQFTCTKDLHEPNYLSGDNSEIIEFVHCSCSEDACGGAWSAGGRVSAVAFTWELLLHLCLLYLDSVKLACLIFILCLYFEFPRLITMLKGNRQ